TGARPRPAAVPRAGDHRPGPRGRRPSPPGTRPAARPRRAAGRRGAGGRRAAPPGRLPAGAGADRRPPGAGAGHRLSPASDGGQGRVRTVPPLTTTSRRGRPTHRRPVRTMLVWCPDWPVIAAGIVDGVPVHAPVAVLHANRVTACSPAARAEGVVPGLRRREAQSRCPDLLVVAADPGRDARAFEPVVGAVEQVAAGVEVVRPGACARAARGPARYFGGEERAAERIVEHLAQECEVEALVGIADGVFRSEERRVGKGWRRRASTVHQKKQTGRAWDARRPGHADAKSEARV